MSIAKSAPISTGLVLTRSAPRSVLDGTADDDGTAVRLAGMDDLLTPDEAARLLGVQASVSPRPPTPARRLEPS
jgi:hypothetical protein